MLLPKKHLALLTLFVWFCILIYYRKCLQTSCTFSLQSNRFEGPANATLGFGAVLVVSTANSPRQSALVQAANVTEIDLTIPEQPAWTERHVEEFMKVLKSTGLETGRGSVLSWLSHINAVEWFMDSGLETALILEDDVDWDIHLRTIQIPQAAAAIRSLLGSQDGYYGSPDNWDILWIGHCGDWFHGVSDGIGPGFHSPSDLTSMPTKVYSDSSLVDKKDMHPFTSSFLDALKLPDKTRFVHTSILPLCTFGYAITRASAAKLLYEIGSPSRPGDTAWDLALMHGCKRKGLRCYTVNPELFHHMSGSSLIAEAEHQEVVYLPPVDAAGLEQAKERNETSNIGCGFSSGDFRFSTAEQLQRLRKEVGRKGKCLKPGRE